jgi:hypothetical protein
MDAIQEEMFESWMDDGHLELTMKNGWAAKYAFTNALKLDSHSKEAKKGLKEACRLLGEKTAVKKSEKSTTRIMGMSKYF